MRKSLVIVLIPILCFMIGCRHTQSDVQAEEEIVAMSPLDNGPVLFSDLFTMQDLSGWQQWGKGWKCGDGTLRQSRSRGSKVGEGFQFVTVEDLPADNYRIEVELRFLKSPRRESFAGIAFRFQDEFNHYLFRFCDFESYQDRLEFYQMVKGRRVTNQDKILLTINPEQWYRLAVEVDGEQARFYLDDKEIFVVPAEELLIGTAGLATKQADVEFRDFRVLPL